MAEPTPQPSKSRGWLKTIIATTAGLLSGAAVMYFTPLVDKIVKPAKPVANFGYETSGLSVTFQNRSIGDTEGWWDFGDGSPLEPVSAKQESVKHTYAKPGVYTAKLNLRNFLGEENERVVTVNLTVANDDNPAIAELKVEPIGPNSIAPATFRVVSQVKNADLCVWNFSDNRPLEVQQAGGGVVERLVTFATPGEHSIKLAVVNGKKTAEQNAVARVSAMPRGATMATVVLSVADQGTKLEKWETPETFGVQFPPDFKDTVYKFEKVIPAKPGCKITGQARVQVVSDRGSRNVRVEVASDGGSAKLMGELVKATGILNRHSPLPALAVRVVLPQERRTVVDRPPAQMSVNLTVPGKTVLPLPALPADWTEGSIRKTQVELREQGGDSPKAFPLKGTDTLRIAGNTCQVSARMVGTNVEVQVSEIRPALAPTPSPR